MTRIASGDALLEKRDLKNSIVNSAAIVPAEGIQVPSPKAFLYHHLLLVVITFLCFTSISCLQSSFCHTMRCYTILGISLAGSAACSPIVEERQSSSLDGFISNEAVIALDGALANIGGTNNSIVTADGTLPGIVVASPSTVNPNYFYTWTRDSALTYTMLIEELIFGNSSFQKTVEDYTTAQAVLQTVTNPSGSLWPAGLGLGEPKFYTNETRFNGDWGRPQRDGPAIRATAFLTLAGALLKMNETNVVKEIYWPLIYNDLLYVGQYWNETGYDLWEEVHGNSFFTMNYQHRALVEGNAIATAIGTNCEPCQQAGAILCFLQNNYWNSTGGYLTADINVNNVVRSGINTDPILSAIHVFDANANCDAGGKSLTLGFSAR